MMDELQDLAASFEKKALALREMARKADYEVDESRLIAKASVYEAEAAGLRQRVAAAERPTMEEIITDHNAEVDALAACLAKASFDANSVPCCPLSEMTPEGREVFLKCAANLAAMGVRIPRKAPRGTEGT